MEPFFFGDGQLFGILHRPPGESNRCGVVLCYPAWREYPNAHRTFRVLAHRLSREGFSCLRFDYYGTGDSAGGGDRGSIRQWVNDVRSATSLLREGGADRIALVGLRLGATLAALSGQQFEDIDALVMWEPVINGKDYLQQVRREQAEWLAFENATHGRLVSDVSPTKEALGYPIGQEMINDLEGIDLTTLHASPAPRCLMMWESEIPNNSLEPDLQALGVETEVACVVESRVWTREVGMYQAFVPAEVVSRTIGWLDGVAR